MKTILSIKPLLLISIMYPALVGQTVPHRLEGSPYPFSVTPETLYVTSERLSQSQRFTIQTLQGLLAQTKPAIIRSVNNWPEDLRDTYGVYLNNTYADDLEGLLDHFRDRIEGYILCNLFDNSSNVAISLCGILQGISVTPADVTVVETVGIPLLIDVRSREEAWVLANYGSQFSTAVVSYQSDEDNHLLSLGDYSVFAGALQFWDPWNSTVTKAAFDRMDTSGVVMGYGADEYRTVETLSPRSLVMHPSDWAANLSVLSNFSVDSLKQKSPMRPFEIRENVHTVCFTMSDGDNVQWLLGGAQNSRMLGNPNRDRVNLGWTISPALCELAPTVMKYIYDHTPNAAEGRNYYIAGPSGRGYHFPDLFPAIEQECELLNRYMEKADLRIVNVLDVDQSRRDITPFLRQSNIDAVFYYNFGSHYVGYGHSILWEGDKPVITGRNALWGDHASTTTIANLLNTQSTAVRSPDAYSLIPVHVWTMPVDSVISCVNKLNSSVRVVAPDEFIWLIRRNLGPSSIQETNRTSNKPSVISIHNGNLYILLSADREKSVSASVYTLSGRQIHRIVLSDTNCSTPEKLCTLKQGLYVIILSTMKRKMVERIAVVK